MAEKIVFKLTESHVQNVCKPGQEEKSCRFLSMGGSGFTCLKFSSLTETLNNKVSKGEMTAKGNNCNSLLAAIIAGKAELIGKKVEYRETMPTVIMTGTLKDIECTQTSANETLPNLLKISGEFEEGAESCQLNVTSLQITETSDYFLFEVCGLGAFAGSTKIYK